MLGIQWMNPHRVAEFRKTVGQGADGRDFGGLHTGVHQGADTGLTPADRHLVEVRVEIAEDDVAMGIDQGDCRRRAIDQALVGITRGGGHRHRGGRRQWKRAHHCDVSGCDATGQDGH